VWQAFLLAYRASTVLLVFCTMVKIMPINEAIFLRQLADKARSARKFDEAEALDKAALAVGSKPSGSAQPARVRVERKVAGRQPAKAKAKAAKPMAKKAGRKAAAKPLVVTQPAARKVAVDIRSRMSKAKVTKAANAEHFRSVATEYFAEKQAAMGPMRGSLRPARGEVTSMADAATAAAVTAAPAERIKRPTPMAVAAYKAHVTMAKDDLDFAVKSGDMEAVREAVENLQLKQARYVEALRLSGRSA
jgi:hypothetical protein